MLALIFNLMYLGNTNTYIKSNNNQMWISYDRKVQFKYLNKNLTIRFDLKGW